MGLNCKDLEQVVGCFDDGTTKQNVIIHTEYGENAAGGTIVVATRYTDSTNNPIDTSAGVVTVGACSVAPPDIEWLELCDVQTDGTIVNFYSRLVTTFDANAVPTTVETLLEEDRVTVYVPTGTVGQCGSDCVPATALGVLTTWG